jgi:glutamate synthase (ferredoxin)
LRKKFTGDPAHVANFFYLVAEEVRELMAELGFRTMDEMIGRSDRLEFKPALDHWKARGLDLSSILHQPRVPAYVGRRFSVPQDHGLDKALDNVSLLRICRPALEKLTPVSASLRIRNTNRVVGTILGSEVTRRYGSNGLPDGTISLLFKGSAGQSLGAFLPPGITISLEGDANDYLGKGLSGGRIVVYPPRRAVFTPEENVIIGNVAFYGATRGEAYIYGIAGERFCVRNSGLNAVVEAVGAHGCEYMTGGRVVVLGSTGRNFAAGMSGGIAYVLDEVGDFSERCNQELVRLFDLDDPGEQEIVRSMIERHVNYTGSRRAWSILESWSSVVERFVKVYPNDYRRVMEAKEQKRAEGLSEQEALMAAFEQNSLDSLGAGGK